MPYIHPSKQTGTPHLGEKAWCYQASIAKVRNRRSMLVMPGAEVSEPQQSTAVRPKTKHPTKRMRRL
jgi:hypothetical protein